MNFTSQDTHTNVDAFNDLGESLLRIERMRLWG